MDEQNILSGGANELAEVRQALENQAAIRNEIDRCQIEVQRLEKQIAAEEKLVADTIETTVNKRRNEVSNSFDKEIAKEKEVLKNAKNKKAKEKDKGMRERMNSETSHLVEANRGLHSEIRTAFEHRGIPGYCDSAWFYTLFMPRSIKEILIFVITAVCLILFVPSVLIMLIGGKWWLNIIIYIVYLMIVAAIYVTIYLFTKDKDKSILVDMREKRVEIQKNEKEIRNIRKDIRNDSDESMYNLTEFDTQIKESEETISDIVVKKNDALADFEQNTKPAIISEITERDKERIDGLKSELEKTGSAKRDSEQKQQELTMSITQKYEAFMGKDMMSLEKVDEMIKLINEGQVTTISEAINKIRATIA